ncbi:trypsin-like peptidase domain-containing protein [Candidatus Woesearchaeota archaeon]|jgi:S1-C subfamily serine protease|nr:trypsin-like peptidase domain-containing protein [Candidatus Woesearchaeota archaeon]MBT6519488.1 trypsin-like peptidase domain-containing protein [Candidatus Woesearchaeota archaeon]MBT7368236.1 trypsin-like peptidase domain-containing protein [Candidatus Woesearchaeota archaeon]
MNKLLTTVLACTMGLQFSCGPALQEIKQITQKENNRLEQVIVNNINNLAESVYCIKTKAEYNFNNENKTIQGTGTGFVYKVNNNHSYIITNAHVVNFPETILDFDINSGLKLYSKNSEKINIIDNIRDSNPADDIPLELVIMNTELDIAILRTPSKLKKSNKFIVDPTINPIPGETAYLIGYHLGYFKGISKGIVANPAVGFTIAKDREKHFIIFDISGDRGSSGGPYFIQRENKLYWVGTNCVKLSADGFMGGVHISEYKDMLAFNPDLILPDENIINNGKPNG